MPIISPQLGSAKKFIATAGSSPRVEATKNTKKDARNFPSTMDVTPTGAVSSIWSVLFFWSSVMLFMVITGITSIEKLNMEPYT